MEFTLVNIQAAQRQYTGVDFPKLIRVFKEMDMTLNMYDLQAGKIEYRNRQGDVIAVDGPQVDVPISLEYSAAEADSVLKRHQAGDTDFQTFCREIANAGVYKWISDMDSMICSYYSLSEAIVVAEPIPMV